MCASSYLRFLSQIFTSSLSSSGLHILRPHLVFTRSDLHRRVTLSLSYHLQDFIMQLLSQLYNLIYLRLQNFISPRSRANRRLVYIVIVILNYFTLSFTPLFVRREVLERITSRALLAFAHCFAKKFIKKPPFVLRKGSKEGSQERFKGGTLSKTTVGIKNRFKGVFKRKVQSGAQSKTTICFQKR